MMVMEGNISHHILLDSLLQETTNMWWEILPSMTIITVAMGIPALATRAINRAIHDGNPCKRNYTQSEPHGVLYHYRDTQHSKPSFWQTYIKEDLQGNGTVYKSNTLADLN